MRKLECCPTAAKMRRSRKNLGSGSSRVKPAPPSSRGLARHATDPLSRGGGANAPRCVDRGRARVCSRLLRRLSSPRPRYRPGCEKYCIRCNRDALNTPKYRDFLLNIAISSNFLGFPDQDVANQAARNMKSRLHRAQTRINDTIGDAKTAIDDIKSPIDDTKSRMNDTFSSIDDIKTRSTTHAVRSPKRRF